MKIGVLALQGDFAEHIVMLKGLGVETAEVRLVLSSLVASPLRLASLLPILT